MNRKQYLLGLLVVIAVTAVLLLTLGQEQPLRLTPFEEAPRPPVRASTTTQPLVLSGHLDPAKLTGNALRRRRNELAQAHREALAAWKAGRRPLREVENLEMLLWTARRQVGEIDDRQFHTALAGLFERELQRLERLHESMMAGEDQVARARLYVARERHLAGLPPLEPDGPDYEAMRVAYLAEQEARTARLVEMGLAHREQQTVDRAQLEHEFPPVSR